MSMALAPAVLGGSTALALRGPVGRISAAYGSTFTLAAPDLGEALALIGGGALLGWIGAFLSASRHLRAIEPGVEP